MPNDQQNTPSTEQLTDVIANSSVGIAVTDRTGAVVLHNRAQSVLMSGEADHLGGRILLDSAQNGLQTLIERLVKEQRVENVQVTYRGIDGGNEHAARVNAVLTGSGDDARIHWVSRPELSERLPVPNDATEDPTSDATSWIRAVNEQPLPALAPTKELEDVMREFYEVAPVAIHLIGVNGQVMHANPADIALVEYTSSPSDYVGGHIRTIYADEGLLDDFLGRWDEDSPIINFRADFLTKQGTPKPVLIFSTAQAEGGSVTNTRCFVFSDPEPQRARDTISAFGWPA